jgi:hypothetical protein
VDSGVVVFYVVPAGRTIRCGCQPILQTLLVEQVPAIDQIHLFSYLHPAQTNWTLPVLLQSLCLQHPPHMALEPPRHLYSLDGSSLEIIALNYSQSRSMGSHTFLPFDNELTHSIE